ncbi:acetoacetate decarboxylase family protein [Streptomyces albus subsp. chlorinus]|uniref:acetoacetate decarboxylase family protein n=1 Tax=Streptomyces albus TaxID=1888 RepID=UPI00156E73D8
MSEEYPPQPWHLRGEMFAALWQLPVSGLPDWHLPPGVRLSRWRNRCAVVTFWVDYRRGGTLAYRELLVAVAVRDRRGPAGCAVEAWVDDARSAAGGRALWGIPKQLARFSFATGLPTGRGGRTHAYTGLVSAPGREDARVGAVQLDVLSLPGRVRLRSRLLQPHLGGVCEVPMRLRATASLARARLSAPPDGPLGYLAGRRPLAAVSLHGFTATVGSPPPDGRRARRG